MRKLKQRLCSLLLCAAMLVSLCPAALAEGGVPYLDENGEEQTCPPATLVKDSDRRWDTGWYVAEGTVNIEAHVIVSGDVHLILADKCSLTVNGGINVREGNSLTIYGQTAGTGKLTATADTGAGIGGGNALTVNESGGTIIITGGTVTASGNKGGAGIGGGHGAGGNITISGGTVEAIADDVGAGIGGGGSTDVGGPGGTITISGGTAAATTAAAISPRMATPLSQRPGLMTNQAKTTAAGAA